MTDWRSCDRCNYDRHLCPGCGTHVPHGTTVCTDCKKEND